jgi:plastocyanin
MRARNVLVAVAVAGLLGACGGGDSKDDSSQSTAKPAASGPSITIKDFKFSPTPASAKVGDTVTISNEDGTNHSVTADDGSFDTTPFSSGSKTITVAKAGTVAYHCVIHSSMKGVIQVAS